jgi:hypothetical protein
MIKEKDVMNRIKSDFSDNAEDVIKFIEEELLSDECLNRSEVFIGNRDRIIRCVIYLANKNLNDLIGYVIAAKDDPRDVMFWAEYINHYEQHPVHVRDFNKPFDTVKTQAS